MEYWRNRCLKRLRKSERSSFQVIFWLKNF